MREYKHECKKTTQNKLRSIEYVHSTDLRNKTKARTARFVGGLRV